MFGKNREELKIENGELSKKVSELTEELGREKDTLTKNIDKLEKDKKQLKEDISDLKLKKKMEEEDIKHMVRIKEEKAAVEMEKKQLEMERAKDMEIEVLRKEYSEKTETFLKEQTAKIEGIMERIMALVPNIGVKLNGKIT